MTDKNKESPVEEIMTEVNKEMAQEESAANAAVSESSQNSKKLGWGWKALSMFLNFIFTALVGGGAGYYVSMSIPSANQVVVYDLDGTMKVAAKLAMKSGGDVEKMTAQIIAGEREKMDEFKRLGVVIIDKSAVLDAPDYLYVKPLTEAEIIAKLKVKPAGVEKQSNEVDALKAEIEALKKAGSKKE
jgi:F0F1-type ATP synthase assembly protein I